MENSTGTEIKVIIEATLQLDDTIKTKIALSDISAYIVLPGATFTQETMANEFGEEEEGGEGQIVVETMEIGLLQQSERRWRWLGCKGTWGETGISSFYVGKLQ